MNILLFITVLFSGLMAGLFYAYSCSVNPGLKLLGDSEYIKAMQSINRAIQNLIFFLPFLGLLLLFPWSTFQLYNLQNSLPWMLITAMCVYFIGVFMVTVLFNVPLNEQLEKFPIHTATENEMSEMRKVFEVSWNRFHTIRTISAIVSFGMALISTMALNN